MFNVRQLFGRRGEDTAVQYLKKNKYRIIERNYKNKLGEVDVIAENKGVIVFVEVKTRSGKSFGNPKESVTLKKQQVISRVALSWLKANRKMDAKARFDVVAIVMKNNQKKIELIKNAFELNYG